jgi:hypothetical protein
MESQAPGYNPEPQNAAVNYEVQPAFRSRLVRRSIVFIRLFEKSAAQNGR